MWLNNGCKMADALVLARLAPPNFAPVCSLRFRADGVCSMDPESHGVPAQVWSSLRRSWGSAGVPGVPPPPAVPPCWTGRTDHYQIPWSVEGCKPSGGGGVNAKPGMRAGRTFMSRLEELRF